MWALKAVDLTWSCLFGRPRRVNPGPSFVTVQQVGHSGEGWNSAAVYFVMCVMLQLSSMEVLVRSGCSHSFRTSVCHWDHVSVATDFGGVGIESGFSTCVTLQRYIFTPQWFLLCVPSKSLSFQNGRWGEPAAVCPSSVLADLCPLD